MDTTYALPAGLFFAVFGFPFLFIEAPIVSIGLFSLEKARTTRAKITVSTIGLGLSLLPCLLGANGSDYETGVAIAWPVGAVIVIFAHVVHYRGIPKQAEQVAAPDR
ncbi:hypothetical protein HW115_19240 [Verrucomicrobiaceae bacterium N1E253]|uniref:Uncharacterized protein n=1 Tax=Oceaniferula marina TaxID=2748318 RepID=A0A851GL23_9BACT|nr:hypothetical protein [Oceaniferula marina]NWK57762.1 hypothetical protein [Oceaniferula marina]